MNVRRVIGGDTVEVAIALPHFVRRLKLRLRGLDCPEIDTPEGKAAKREVEKLVRAAQSVTIYTSKPDKYDRYLADVFLVGVADDTLKGESPKVKDQGSDQGSGSQLSTFNSQLREAPLFLNDHLLAHGFAARMDAEDFGDEKS